MHLHCAQIARSLQQLRAAAVTKRMRVELSHTGARPDRLHELPDAMIGHSAFTPDAALRAISDDKERIALPSFRPVVLDVIRQDVLGDLGQCDARFIPSLALHSRETE